MQETGKIFLEFAGLLLLPQNNSHAKGKYFGMTDLTPSQGKGSELPHPLRACHAPQISMCPPSWKFSRPFILVVGSPGNQLPSLNVVQKSPP